MSEANKKRARVVALGIAATAALSFFGPLQAAHAVEATGCTTLPQTGSNGHDVYYAGNGKITTCGDASVRGQLNATTTMEFGDPQPANYASCTLEMWITDTTDPSRQPAYHDAVDCLAAAQSNDTITHTIGGPLVPKACTPVIGEVLVAGRITGTFAGQPFERGIGTRVTTC